MINSGKYASCFEQIYWTDLAQYESYWKRTFSQTWGISLPLKVHWWNSQSGSVQSSTKSSEKWRINSILGLRLDHNLSESFAISEDLGGIGVVWELSKRRKTAGGSYPPLKNRQQGFTNWFWWLFQSQCKVFQSLVHGYILSSDSLRHILNS